MVTGSANRFVFQGSRLSNMDDFVRRNRVRFVKVPGDGHCGFVSVALSAGLITAKGAFCEMGKHGVCLSKAGWEVAAQLRAATADMLNAHANLIMSVRSKIAPMYC